MRDTSCPCDRLSGMREIICRQLRLLPAADGAGGERGPRGEAVSPLRHEPVADRRDGPEHSLKHRPDPRGRRV
jgi:hypothetical protein